MTSKYPPLILIEVGVYSREGAWTWWRSANQNLGGRKPVDLWFSGHRTVVADEINRLTGDLNA